MPFSLANVRGGLLEQRYKEKVDRLELSYDEAQLHALTKLQQLLEKLPAYEEYNQQSGWRKRLQRPVEKCVSLYIFGDVGRGKSMLMDLFYETCPISLKRRVHFLAFMQEVHAFVHQWRQHHKSDALTALAEKIRTSTLLLCFDEFHVTDIADAMMLVGLFKHLFNLGIVMVITSNRHPYDLHRGGLLKEQFIPFVELLEVHTEVIRIASMHDYRFKKGGGRLSHYFFPLNTQSDKLIKTYYNRLTGNTPGRSKTLKIMGRSLTLACVHHKTAMTTFAELCEQPLGPAEYLALAQTFQTLIITDIPKLNREKRNEAKRFVILIDALYEHKVSLICSAEVSPGELYTEGDGFFEFGRTVSRLMEMQSDAYCPLYSPA
jgi:cell division protein ZapE